MISNFLQNTAMKVNVLFIALVAQAQVEEAIKDTPRYTKSTIKAPFLEQFESLQNWFPSTSKKQDEHEKDLDLLQYRGLWDVESPIEELLLNDYGLVLKTLAAHSAICSKFITPIDPKDKDLVIQYEVKTQTGHDCGGAYLKLLTYKKNFKPETFDDKTDYTIMFGPDKCGSSNKVHFIFRHQSPITKEFEEKHMVSPPKMISDKRTNLYTLVVNKDQTFHIKINNQVVESGSLLKDFEPPVNPPKEIDDKKDSKPSTWDDAQKIVDPSAEKPADWDESEPKEIVDESKTMPEDWLENEPGYVPDPEVTKPEVWDDEEDGDWTAPSVPNPKCVGISGCGKWTQPMIPNPKYKGKWTAPMIDNPNYKGKWAPRKISNPKYFEDLKPANFNKIVIYN
jgi:calnexin